MLFMEPQHEQSCCFADSSWRSERGRAALVVVLIRNLIKKDQKWTLLKNKSGEGSGVPLITAWICNEERLDHKGKGRCQVERHLPWVNYC